MDFCFDSVVDVPQLQARAIFVTDTTTLFKEDGEISPIQLDEHTQYVPWGADNLMPYNVLKKIEAAEERTIIDAVRQTTLEMLAGKTLDYKRMFFTVQRIHTRPATFPVSGVTVNVTVNCIIE